MNSKRILLVNLFPPNLPLPQAQEDASEMYRLVESLGNAEVIDMVNQRGYPQKTAFIGTGKADEIAELIKELQIDVVVINGIAKPRQLYALWKIMSEVNKHILVWDRVDLILNIFSEHAHTAEAKLQIELANMRHMGPKIYGMGLELSQQGGGIGTRGIGETNVELMKRHWKDAIRRVREKLVILQQTKSTQIQQRKRISVASLSIVGYTNAGKTTLFNQLTHKGTYADNLLFATLDSTVGKIYLPTIQKEVFIADTIGFIQDLPPSLIDAFKSTLLEAIYADILIHVLDGSSSSIIMQLHVVEQILEELGLSQKDELIVINKSDELHPNTKKDIESRLTYSKPLYISAKTGEGIEELITEIARRVTHISESAPATSLTTYAYDSELPTRDELSVGMEVSIVQKHDQSTGMLTKGTIQRILSHGASHPNGIKVELSSGEIGRVKYLGTN